MFGDVISLFLSSSAISVSPASDVTGSPLKLTITGHDFSCPNTNCSGIQLFLSGVILQTAGIVLQYTFWQFLTPLSSILVRNPGLVLFNFSLYKYFHLEHHRYTSVEGDTEPWGTFPNLWFYIATLPTIALSTAFWKMSWMATKGLYPDFVKTPSARRSVDRDNWIQLIWLLLIGVLTIILPLLMASLYWIPLIISLPMLFLTNLSEHYDCDWGPNQWNNTRTITSNPIFRYYFWNANYHAEHHVYPGIPSYNYPKVHQLIGYRFKYVEKSYVMFHLKLIWSLIVGTKALGELPEIQPNHRIDYTYVMVDEKKESLFSLEE